MASTSTSMEKTIFIGRSTLIIAIKNSLFLSLFLCTIVLEPLQAKPDTLPKAPSTKKVAKAATRGNSKPSGSRPSPVVKKPAQSKSEQEKAILRSVRSHVEVLASDQYRGRGSATEDEFTAARYIAAELKRYSIQPAGENHTYFQRVSLDSPIVPEELRASYVGRTTTNVVAVLRGSDAKASQQTVLLTAHLDHLGVGPAVNGDTIYNGADDDASGVAAVLEFARVLSLGPRPRRTVVFALFGSEEIGGYGATYFQEHPPVPLKSIIANLEFEMIGRPDPAVTPHTLWLTGYERSNLGAELATHGASLVNDPHPEQYFFRRSDNYILAKRGIIAHTVSSFNLHDDYHRPSDDVSHIDFDHLADSIQSFISPVRWLCNSDFVPRWNPGQQP